MILTDQNNLRQTSVCKNFNYTQFHFCNQQIFPQYRDLNQFHTPLKPIFRDLNHVQKKRPKLKAKSTWHLTRGLCRSQICKNWVPPDHGFGTTVSLEVRARPGSVRSRQNRQRKFVTDCMVLKVSDQDKKTQRICH